MQHGWWSGRIRATQALAVAAALLIGFVVVALAADVPGDGRSWPGQGFVAFLAIGLVGLACLVEAVFAGRRRRHGSSDGHDERT